MGHLRRSARKRVLERVAGILVAVCVVAPGAAAAQTIYRLTDASSFQEGCFAPCMCPVMEQRPVRGTFGLRFTGSDGGFDRYAVEDVHWKVPGRDPELLVNGSGTYTVGNPDATAVRKHRLELDLRLGGAAAEHYDSGWVAGANLPHIQTSISLHGMYCYDRVFAVDADPVPASEIEPYALVAGSTFQRGCFDACDCAIGPQQPLAGTVSLLA